MQIVRWGVGLIARSALGLVALAAVSHPLQNNVPRPSTPSMVTPPIVSPATTQTNQEWSFQIDEPTLTREVNTWAAGQSLVETSVGSARLKDLRVELRNSQLVVRGTADTGWLSAPVDATASASVQTGRVLVQVSEAHINGVDLPELARRELDKQLQDQLDQSVAVNRVAVRSVRVADGKLVVSGTRQ
jgi:hypothetical protein